MNGNDESADMQLSCGAIVRPSSTAPSLTSASEDESALIHFSVYIFLCYYILASSLVGAQFQRVWYVIHPPPSVINLKYHTLARRCNLDRDVELNVCETTLSLSNYAQIVLHLEQIASACLETVFRRNSQTRFRTIA